METIERRRDRREHPAPGPGEDPGASADRAALREQGARLLEIGNDIIERTLSGDSEAFLRASRQEGGQ